MKTILVIEDEIFVRENIVEILESTGYKVFSASNGIEGVQQAEKHLPDLILCDVMMPDLDGHGVLEKLKLNTATAMIPFVFLTARADTSDMRLGMNRGADDYITKPFRVAELLHAVELRLKKQEAIKQDSERRLADLRTNLSLSLPHEFLTPISGILGFSELLLSSFQDLAKEEITEMLVQLHSSARRLHRLVQNFLLYAKLVSLASDPKSFQITDYDVTSSTKNIVSEITYSKADQEQRTKDIILTDNDDAAVAMSTIYVSKIIEEIVDNALKYSQPNTPITIHTHKNDRFFECSVTNQGRGISPEQIADIGAYTQFDRKIYEQQGSGLGLSIAQKLLSFHKGHLSIKSGDGQTTVTFSIPIYTKELAL